MRTASQWEKIYDSKDFQRNNYYSGNDLGANCSDNQTTIKLWSPSASQITVNFYHNGDIETPAFRSEKMERGDSGVWCFVVDSNYHKVYYDFLITIDNSDLSTIDPYAKTASANGIRGMIVDSAQTNPNGWTDDIAPPLETETVISEIHIKELSWHPSGGWPENVRGKFKALTLETTLNNAGNLSTGLTYFKNLGITHLQLMPIYDFGSIDEIRGQGQFNWGYDPVNYNVPEGSYSTDPHNGEVRVRELKEAIKSIHDHGLRVVMDVVYNHTWNLENALQRTAPYYFYRTTPEGYLSNGSGCGNDIASERPMVHKYIIDSILYWAREFHIDGFRFDLMGLLTVDLMNDIRQTLDKEFGAGEKLIYGEPWVAAKTFTVEDRRLATKDNYVWVNDDIGFFCDDTRDTIKGSTSDGSGLGFVNGASGLEQDIVNSIMAWRLNGSNIKSPKQVINYVASHDNHTLWDKLTLTTDDEETRKKQYKLATAIYILCQGRPFMLSGSAFYRTKNGRSNTYNAPIEIGQLNWEKIYSEKSLIDFHRGIIDLRKQLPALYDKDIHAHLRLQEPILAPGLAGAIIDNDDAQHTSRWSMIYLIFNSNKEHSTTIELRKGGWDILATSDDSWLWKNPETAVGNAVVAPLSFMVLGLHK